MDYISAKEASVLWNITDQMIRRHCRNGRIPGSVQRILSQAFFRSGIRELTIESGVQSIYYGVFSDLVNLKEVYIPESVTYMDQSIFSGCTALTDIYCQAAEQPSKWSLHWNTNTDAEVHFGAQDFDSLH